ncbi:MAG: hypothetical protein ACI4ON_04190 [Clostridia bacterium]
MKIKIKYIEKSDSATVIENDNYIALYLFNIIKIKKIKIERKVHTEDNNKDNRVVNTVFMIIKQILRSLQKEEIVKIVTRILKSIKVKSLNMDLGINLQDSILNAYSIAIINSILPIFLAKHSKNIDLNNISYTTFISKKVINLKIDSIIYVSIVKNITSIIKIIFIILKGGIKNGNKTSNRISNDNINDFNRKYGRC